MAKQTINNEETGLVVRGKINDNFTELYDGKIDKDGAKVLSDENYTAAEKSKLGNIENNAKDDQNASEVPVDVTNFNNNLSASDDTVQKALETIDDLSIVESSTVTDIVTITQTAYDALGTPDPSTFYIITG
jgi:hypothetical protein